MPSQQSVTRVRLANISTCVTITVNTLNILVKTLMIHGLEAMMNTTQSLLKLIQHGSQMLPQTIKQGKNECAQLMEQTHVILSAIIGVYVRLDTGIELPPSTSNDIANFTQEKLAIHKAFQFIGDVHLMENDEVTAVTLFTVALEGFTSPTWMSIVAEQSV
ncbi:hypothetical protein B0H16DRAFT_1690371 [Mycena metata]|uniref:Uncharacterized protein n=1 Tax=Mycena metata TaxID=1033252 RepID=A0AAD7J333_9AGAR|nr:hypothetical protein B0H16DRAFT_1690371 [Mycena metata]